PKIVAPFNKDHQTSILPFGDLVAVEQRLQHGDIAGVIIEGIQGINGIQVPEPSFLLGLATLCKQYGSKLILDEVQSGYARTGRFFAHQWVEGLQPDLITTAKGMGNGYPIGGVLIHPDFKASFGLLGTTFGGNHLACAAGLAVLEVIEQENLLKAADRSGTYLIDELNRIDGIQKVRGKGLMIGIDLEKEAAPVRKELITQYHIFTGSSAGKHTIRLLPPLNIPINDLTLFLESIQKSLALSQV